MLEEDRFRYELECYQPMELTKEQLKGCYLMLCAMDEQWEALGRNSLDDLFSDYIETNGDKRNLYLNARDRFEDMGIIEFDMVEFTEEGRKNKQEFIKVFSEAEKEDGLQKNLFQKALSGLDTVENTLASIEKRYPKIVGVLANIFG